METDRSKHEESLAPVPTAEERAAHHRALRKMHVGNRFRLMFGMPLLPEPGAVCSLVVCDSVKAGECDGCALASPADHGKRYPLKYGWCWQREMNVRLTSTNVEVTHPETKP
jgi:hypothetical protein